MLVARFIATSIKLARMARRLQTRGNQAASLPIRQTKENAPVNYGALIDLPLSVTVV